MAKIDQYYVDSDGNPSCNVVIRDRISPMRKLTHPTDIAVEITMGMFVNRAKTIILAEQICAILNRGSR